MQIKLIATIASIAILASCNRSAEEQKAKAEQAQQIANEKITQANVEGQLKANTAQKEADEKIAQASANAQEASSKAQQVANQDIRQANEGTLKLRNDYQVETSKTVGQIDNRIDSLRVKAQSSKPKAKAQFENMMPKVVAQRATVTDDLANLPNQTTQTLTNFKAKTNKDIDDLRKVVDEVAMNL